VEGENGLGLRGLAPFQGEHHQVGLSITPPMASRQGYFVAFGTGSSDILEESLCFSQLSTPDVAAPSPVPEVLLLGIFF